MASILFGGKNDVSIDQRATVEKEARTREQPVGITILVSNYTLMNVSAIFLILFQSTLNRIPNF